MIDPSYEIIHAIVTLLNTKLTYGTTRFSVYEDLSPTRQENNYVWFPDIIVTDESTADDEYLKGVQLTIQVVSTGHREKVSRKAIVGIGSIILNTLIRVTLSMANNVMSYTPELVSINHGVPINEDGSMSMVSNYVLEMKVEESIGE